MNSFKFIALKIDDKFIVKEELANTMDGLEVAAGKSLLTIFDESAFDSLFDALSSKVEHKATSLLSINQSLLEVYFFGESFDSLVIIVEGQGDSSILFEEIMRINNYYINEVRTLSKQVKARSNYDELMNETMRLNNELINVRRELSIQNKRLEKGSFTDVLTKLNNRRKYFDDIYRFVKEENYILCLIDINNFKRINDELGHAVGDEALIRLSKLMNQYSRSVNGNVYRLGGDEFAFLIPESSMFDMKNLTDLANKELRTIHPATGISYGAVIVTKENCNTSNKAEERMSIADSLMYEMKRNIKNEEEVKKR